MTRVLVLWDIDQTLLKVGPLTGTAYAGAFRAATGQDMGGEPWRYDGRTELAAVTEVLESHGFEPENGLLERFFDALVAEFETHSGEMLRIGQVLPGAPEALAAVGAAIAYQSVLTGNLYELAVLKMTLFGLAEHIDFRIGAYGGDAFERRDLPAIALARVDEHIGLRLTGAEVVVVGDTRRDIAAGQVIGARTVGIATGRATEAELSQAGADAVLPDLSDTEALLNAITGP